MSKVLPFRRPRRPPRDKARHARRPPAWGWLAAAAMLAAVVAGYAWDVLPPGPRGGITTDPGYGRFALCAPQRQRDCVIDGDTVRLGDERIRLEDINAPETHRPACPAERELGQRATQRLLALMNAGPFTVVDDGGRDRDRYDRQLRRLERDGRSLGATLVDEGLARPWSGRRRSWCD